MSLVSRITLLAQAIAADIKNITSNYIRRRTTPTSLYRAAHEVATYSTTASAATGALVVRMSSNAAVFNVLQFIGYKYVGSGRAPIDFTVSGYFYNVNKTWINHAVQYFSRENPTVALGYETATGLPVIVIGSVTTVWPYPSIAISRAQGAYVGVSDAYFDGWTITLTTDLSIFTLPTTPTECIPEALPISEYLTTQLPPAASFTGKLINTRLATTGQRRVARSDGTAWLDFESGLPLDYKMEVSRELADPMIFHDFVRSGVAPNNMLFSRSSVGTYFGNDGILKTAPIDRPRIDHDPDTGVCLGLLIEPAATNIIPYSEGDPFWIGAGNNPPVVDSTSMVYDGITCTKTTIPVVSNVGFNETRVSGSSGSLTINRKYVWSAWFCFDRELVEGEYIYIYCTGAAGLSTTTITGPTTGITKWKRYTSVEPQTAIAAGAVYFCVIPGVMFTPCVMYSSRRQLEEGYRPTSYIKTTGAAATRARDNARFKLNTNRRIKSWVVYSESMTDINVKPLGGGDQVVWNMSKDDITTNFARMVQHYSTTGYPIFMVLNGVTSIHGSRATSLVQASKTIARYAIRFADNEYKASFNGALINKDAYFGTPVSEFNTIQIGGATGVGADLNGWVRKITIWADGIEDANLQALTS